MRLSARLTPVAELTAEQREAMLALMQRHYANVQPAAFWADLGEKRWAILVSDGGGLCGFSTQTVLCGEADGRPFQALFSGDTIIDRERWGDPALAGAWGRLALSLIDRADGELYWSLLSQGYKTYRFLPVYFHEFYPRHNRPTPARERAVLDALAGGRYPDAYDPTAGVVRAGPGQYRLREGVAEISAQRMLDPDVRFFTQANPGHAAGDELCCVAPLTRANFTRAAYRVIGPEAAEAI